jgi:hypothetical protein
MQGEALRPLGRPAGYSERAAAERLGGTTHPAGLQPELALLASVYSEQAPAVERVIDALQPYVGELKVEDSKDDSYALSGKKIYFYTACWSPRLYIEREAPAVLGSARSRPQPHWDLHTGVWDLHTGVRASNAPVDLCRKVGAAAFALAASPAELRGTC